jgi:hypothetical protein
MVIMLTYHVLLLFFILFIFLFIFALVWPVHQKTVAVGKQGLDGAHHGQRPCVAPPRPTAGAVAGKLDGRFCCWVSSLAQIPRSLLLAVDVEEFERPPSPEKREREREEKNFVVKCDRKTRQLCAAADAVQQRCCPVVTR